MGCSTCSIEGGCEPRKAEQRSVFDEVLARLYPDRVWGRPDDEARFRAGVPRGEARRLGRAVASLLRAPTYFQEGSADDLCDFLYVLCLGREPSLHDVRAGRAAAPPLADGASIRERYLRVALSTVARMAAVQEVELALDDDNTVVRESPRAGVYDPTLLARTRKLTGLLGASDLLYVDFGLLDKPVDGAQPGDYVTRFGVEPRLCNFLFYAQPPTTAIITPI